MRNFENQEVFHGFEAKKCSGKKCGDESGTWEKHRRVNKEKKNIHPFRPPKSVWQNPGKTQ